MNQEQPEGEKEKNQTLYEEFPFLLHVKSRLVSWVCPDTGRKYTGHVAMYYKDSGRIRIDWDNGATTYNNFTTDSRWVFKLARRTKE